MPEDERARHQRVARKIAEKLAEYRQLRTAVFDSYGNYCGERHPPIGSVIGVATEILQSEYGFAHDPAEAKLAKMVQAAENLSMILHELEEVGVDLTEAQEQRWSEVTAAIQEIGYGETEKEAVESEGGLDLQKTD